MIKDSIPPSESSSNWRSASQVRHQYASHVTTISRKVEAFRDEMVSALVSTGRISEKDAIFAVSQTLVRLERGAHPPVLRASPVVFEMLDLTEQDKAPPPPSEGWKSANQLRWEGFIGGNVKFTRQMEEIRDTTTQSLIKAGLSQEDAVMIVDKTLVGGRKPESGGAVSVLCASPIAQDMMELKMREGQPRVGRPPKDNSTPDNNDRSR